MKPLRKSSLLAMTLTALLAGAAHGAERSETSTAGTFVVRYRIALLPSSTGTSTSGSSINEWRQVVGQSCDAGDHCVGFLWQSGKMTDLNTLLSPSFDGTILTANDIDDFGRITGQAIDMASGTSVAFVATPYLIRYP
ncbi:hypothetical protein [Luteimonas panaciterrae]|uniref:hypothetical protein n=1 Tax=Luteimonas panaciterrae TaxID=363885 RepID=UPI001CFB82EE|nr:hypothetical protein [Luteimonas panaciterrae]